MRSFDITLPDSFVSRLVYLMIIFSNALVTYRLPSTFQGLVYTCIIYAFLLTGKMVCKTLAVLLSIARLSQLFQLPTQVPFWSMVVTYCLSFLICWIMYKLSVSVDNTQLLTLFNVKLLDPPVLYLKILDHNAAYFSWEHSCDERQILSYEIEINNMIVGQCEPHERSIGVPTLRPNTSYRIRIWANSRTRGRAPSTYLMFKTLEEPPVEPVDSPQSPKKEFSIEEQIKRLEMDKVVLQTSRENIRLELKQLNSEEQPHVALMKQLTNVRLELQSLEDILCTNQAEVEALREEKARLTSIRTSLEQRTEEMATQLSRTESSLKSRLKEIETEERNQAGHPSELGTLEKRFKQDKNKLEQELREINKNNLALEAKLAEHNATLKSLQEKLKHEEVKYQKLLQSLAAAKGSQQNSDDYLRLKNYCELVAELGQKISEKKEMSEQLGELSAKKLTLLHSLAQLNQNRTPPTESERNPAWMRPSETPTSFAPHFESLLSRQHSAESLSTDFPWPRIQPTWLQPRETSPPWIAEEEAEAATDDQESVPSWLLPSRSSFESSSCEEPPVDALYTPPFTSASWTEAPRVAPSFSAWPSSQPLSRRSTFRSFSSFPSPFSDAGDSTPLLARVTTTPLRREDEPNQLFQEVFGTIPRMAPPSQHHTYFSK